MSDPRATAEEIVLTYGGSVGLMDAIIDAIMAERERCAKRVYDSVDEAPWLNRTELADVIRQGKPIESGANAAANSPALAKSSHEEAAQGAGNV